MATHDKTIIFDSLQMQLGPKLWLQLVTKNANAEVIWSINESLRLVATTLWMDDANFERLGTDPSPEELTHLAISWKRSKDLTVKPDEVEVSVQK